MEKIGHTLRTMSKEDREYILHAVKNGKIDNIELWIARGGNVNYRELREQESTLLHLAVKVRQLEVIKTLIDFGARIDAFSSLDEQPLHLACKDGMRAIAEILIKNGANLEAKNRFGLAPIHLAIECNYIEIVMLLFNAGANINAVASKRYNNLTPLQFAAEKGFAEIVKFLLQNGAMIDASDAMGRTSLVWATIRNHQEVVEILIKGGAKLDICYPKTLQSPLHFASGNGYTEIVNSLIRNGANINARDVTGRTPLFWATSRNKLNVVQVLIKEGADMNICAGSDMQSPIYLAVAKGFEDVANTLITNGADVNLRFGPYGLTPLFRALWNDNTCMVLNLLKHGAKMIKTSTNQTPLHIAASKCAKEICQMLLDHGADVNAIDNKNAAPLHYALRLNKTEEDQEAFIDILISNGANVNMKGTVHEFTPLHISIGFKKLRIIKILLKNGASLYRKNAYGKSPLEHALDKKFNDVFKMLLGAQSI